MCGGGKGSVLSAEMDFLPALLSKCRTRVLVLEYCTSRYGTDPAQ